VTVNVQPIRALVVAAVLALQSGLAVSAPEVGWWWNRAESGRGFFIESHDGVIFMAGYFYANDGRATWLVSGGSNADPYAYTGRLLAESDGQTLTGDYHPPSAPIDSGAVSLHFSSDTQGTLTWPGGTIAIERQRFGGEDAPFQPDSGWWWNPEESGRGYSVEVQGDKLFAVAFMYDAVGNPVWYYTAGTMASATSYDGPWMQFAHGQTLGGAYRFPDTPAPIGRLHIDFTAIDQAVFTMSDSVAPVATSMSKEGRILEFPTQRQLAAKPTYVPARRYDGNFTQTFEEVNTTRGHGATLVTTTTWTVVGLVAWVVSEDMASLGVVRGPHETYTLKGSDDFMPIKLTANVTQNGLGEACSGSVEKSFPFSNDGSHLDVSGFGDYKGNIELKAIEVMLPRTCTDLETGETTTINLLVRTGPSLKIVGPAPRYGLTGSRVTVLSTGDTAIKVTDSWSFAAVTAP
jgi:hypothetical protein